MFRQDVLKLRDLREKLLTDTLDAFNSFEDYSNTLPIILPLHTLRRTVLEELTTDP